MKLSDWLKDNIRLLKGAGIATAQLDAEVFLADALGKDRSWLHAHSNDELSATILEKLLERIERRTQHVPLAYIRGVQEFYGRNFHVSPDTLTPRPETETMLELLLEHIQDPKSEVQDLNIIDVGTGSGCIIITADLELSKIKDLGSKVSCTGLDISKPALEIARRNAKKLKADTEFKEFDLLTDGLSSISDPQSSIYLANLPYVPEDLKINLAASHEPAFAIYGGKDGLDYFRALFSQLKDNKCTIFTESLPPQHKELEKIAKESGFSLIKTQDLIQIFTCSQ